MFNDADRSVSGPALYLLQGLVLVIVLVLATVVTRSMLAPAQETASSPPATPLPAVAPASPSPTPRPSPTATSTPTPSPTPTSTATPPPPTIVRTTPAFTVSVHGTPAVLPIPTPVPQVELADGVINIVLLGADQETIGNGALRTDVIVVASINPEGPYVSLLSIPRDLYLWIPGQQFGKINTAYGGRRDFPAGGPSLVKDTIEYNLGIPIDFYALVDFAGFVQIVDALGGVDVPVECGLHDTFPNPANPEEGVDVDYEPGVQRLDGLHTLWYVRSRWSTHDFDRNRRQQQVLRALYRQALALDAIPRIPELWEALQQTVQTDLGLDELVYLGWVGSRLEWANVKSRFIAPPYLEPVRDAEDAYILLPVPGALEPLIAEALQPPAAGRANQPPFRVEVSDGTGRPGMAAVAAERLHWEGFEVVGVGPADQVIPRTQIVDFTTTNKGSPLWLLARLYGRSGGDIVYQPTEGSPAHFRILLGADYDPCVPSSVIQYVPAPTPTPTPTS